MNRCIPAGRRDLLARLASACALAPLLLAGGAATAQVVRPFPATALRGEITFGQPPELLLNGQPARLAPGGRIRGEDNLVQMSASLVGRSAVVNYTLEPTTGLVMQVWLLRREEAAVQPWPRTAEEAARWTFDPAAQTWSRR